MDLILPRMHGHTAQAMIGGIVAASGTVMLAVTRWLHGPLLAVDADTATTAIVGVGAGSLLGGLAAAGTALISAATERKKVLAEIELKREEQRQAAWKLEQDDMRLLLAATMTAELAEYLDDIESWVNQVRRTSKNRYPTPPDQPDLPDALRIVRARVLASRSNVPPAPVSEPASPPPQQGTKPP